MASNAAVLYGVMLGGCLSNRHSSPERLRILVLGGTNFLGPAVVEEAISRGHEVTLFNRGITRPYLFPDLRKIRGDRKDKGGLAALEGSETWDIIIDTWPENASLVRESTQLLSDRAEMYFFCSSIAVYRNFGSVGITEESPVHEDDPGWYGGEKVLAEEAVKEAFGDRHHIVRCHAILGPRDDGASYHYWLNKIASNDQILAPGSGMDPVQYVDVRDVALWMVDSAEKRRLGVYNLTGPFPPITFRTLLEETRDALSPETRMTWVDADFLRTEQDIASFADMPLWAPLDEDVGFYQISGQKLLKPEYNIDPFSIRPVMRGDGFSPTFSRT